MLYARIVHNLVLYELFLAKILEYPLVTHDLNMLKKVTGELIWKIKSVSSRREIPKFPVETVHTSTRGLYIP